MLLFIKFLRLQWLKRDKHLNQHALLLIKTVLSRDIPKPTDLHMMIEVIPDRKLCLGINLFLIMIISALL
jgi:hypothetical protein